MVLVPSPPRYDDPMAMEMGFTWHSPLGIASDIIRETVHAFAEVSTPREVLEARRRELLRNVEDTSLWGRFKKKTPFRNVGKVESEKHRIASMRRIDPRAPYSPSEDGPRLTLWARLLRKFVVGLSLVGILSFLKWVLPVHWWYF
jgi:hypothetical protein